MQNQLEALDAKREAEGGQSHKSDPAPGTRPIRRCKPLPQKEPERHKDGDVRKRLDRPLSTLPEHAGEIQRQVMPGSESANIPGSPMNVSLFNPVNEYSRPSRTGIISGEGSNPFPMKRRSYSNRAT